MRQASDSTAANLAMMLPASRAAIVTALDLVFAMSYTLLKCWRMWKWPSLHTLAFSFESTKKPDADSGWNMSPFHDFPIAFNNHRRPVYGDGYMVEVFPIDLIELVVFGGQLHLRVPCVPAWTRRVVKRHKSLSCRRQAVRASASTVWRFVTTPVSAAAKGHFFGTLYLSASNPVRPSAFAQAI